MQLLLFAFQYETQSLFRSGLCTPVGPSNYSFAVKIWPYRRCPLLLHPFFSFVLNALLVRQMKTSLTFRGYNSSKLNVRLFLCFFLWLSIHFGLFLLCLSSLVYVAFLLLRFCLVCLVVLFSFVVLLEGSSLVSFSFVCFIDFELFVFCFL